MNYDGFAKRCKEKNTSPTAVSIKVGLKKGNASNWKNGGNPSVEILMALAVELDCTTDFLLGLSNVPTQEKTPSEIDERLKLFFLLDDDDKQDIFEQMEYKLSRDKYKQDALPVNEAI